MFRIKIYYILAFFSITIYSVAELNFAIVGMWIIFFLLGCYLTNKLSADKESLRLFGFSYSIYTLYMVLTNYILVQDPYVDFFYAIDSTKFWRNSAHVDSFNSLITQFRDNASGYGSTREYRLFNFICLVVAYLSSFLGENHVLIQKYQCVFLGALSMPLIYLVLLKYTNNKEYSLKATKLFALFSFVSTFAVVYSRDIHIYYFYTLAFYLVVCRLEKPSTMWYLLVLIPTTFFFRFEHGIFISLFAFVFIFASPNKYFKYYLPIVVLIPIFLALGSRFFFFALESYDSYSQRRIDAAGDTDSLAVVFSNFPFGIKQLLLAFIGQTTPLPFWRFFGFGVTDSNSVAAQSHHILRFMEGISGFLWPFVWGVILYGVTKGASVKIPKELKVLFAVAILLLLVTTADIHVRRIFAVYPITFAVASLLYYNFSKSERFQAISQSLVFMILLYSVYFLIKI